MIINNELSAEIFLNEIKKANLTGREFLALIGNSKLDNSAFLEIKNGTGLTKERLYRIFEESSLTSADYYRMLAAAFELKRRKEEKKREDNEKKLRQQIEDANKKRSEAKLTEWKTSMEKETEPIPDESLDTNLPEEEPYRIEDKRLHHEMNSDNSDVDFDDEENDDKFTRYKNKNSVLSDDDFDDDEKTNTGKIIISLILAFCLAVSSFVVRYAQTGSFFLQNAGIIELKPLETYLELAGNIFKLPEIRLKAPRLEGDFYINKGAAASEAGKSSVTTPNYTFYVYGNTLYGLDLNSGTSEFTFSITKNDMTLNSFYISGDKLYVIYDYTYDKPYNSNFQLNSEIDENVEDEPTASPISGKYEQNATAVDIYNAVSYNPSPIAGYTLDGEFMKIGEILGKVYIVTEFVPFEPAYSDDPEAFVPSFSVNGLQNLVPIENITVSNKPESKRMTVIGFAENNLTALAVGGENSCTVSFGESLYVVLGKGNNTEVLRYDESLNVVSFMAKGIVYDTSIDEANGIVRICAESENETILYTLDTEFNLLSVVEKIAGGEQLKNVLFDDKTVYIIGERIYAIDTSIPSEPYIAERISASIYSDNYYRWSDNERILLEYTTDSNGIKTGISLTVFKLEKEVYTEIASKTISIESTISGNWNEFFKSPIETEEYELFLMPRKGLIILPFSYFNGISEIDKFIIFEYGEHTGINEVYEYTEYDSRADKLASAVSDTEQVYLFTDDRINTFNLSAINNVD